MRGTTTSICTRPNYGFIKWGSLTLSGTSYSDKTIELTTHGRPIFLGIAGNNNPVDNAWCRAHIFRNDTELAFVTCHDPGQSRNRPFSIFHIDVPTPGTYTYKARVQTNSGTVQYTEQNANEAPCFIAFEM